MNLKTLLFVCMFPSLALAESVTPLTTAIESRNPNLSLQAKVTITQREGKTYTVPYYPVSTNTIITVKENQVLSKLDKLRIEHGGVLPYTIVPAKESFVIVTEAGDLLIIGLKNVVYTPYVKPIVYEEKIVNGKTVLVETEKVPTTLVVTEHLKICPDFPKFLPPDIVKTSSFSNVPSFSPNRKLTRATKEVTSIANQDCTIYVYSQFAP